MRSRLLGWIAAVLVVGAVAFVYFGPQRKTNPPGFAPDESSIAYNALTIARSGVDEHGIAHPLYFRAFGEYKNPVYIYLLAGIFELFTPTNLVARTFSALLGFAAAALLGVLGWKVTGRRSIGLITFATAALTPGLFEPTRLVFEEALYPLVLAGVLFVVFVALRRERLNVSIVAALAFLLALLTYTYSIGRVHAPLLLIAFVVVAFRRDRFLPLAALVAVYAVLVAPIWWFNRQHPGSITGRAEMISYVPALRGHPVALIEAFEQHYVENLAPLGYVLAGDPFNRHHVRDSGGSLLLMTVVLAAVGAARVVTRPDRWWWFVIAGVFLSVVPASLMSDRYHSLRLLPYPIFLIVLSIPALELLPERPRWRVVVAVALVAGAAQAAWFFRVYARDGINRPLEFDVGFRPVLRDALRRPQRPIYIQGDDRFVHACWFGAQMGATPKTFVALGDWPPPPHALVIGEKACAGCEVVSSHAPAVAYATP